MNIIRSDRSASETAIDHVDPVDHLDFTDHGETLSLFPEPDDADDRRATVRRRVLATALFGTAVAMALSTWGHRTAVEPARAAASVATSTTQMLPERAPALLPGGSVYAEQVPAAALSDNKRSLERRIDETTAKAAPVHRRHGATLTSCR